MHSEFKKNADFGSWRLGWRACYWGYSWWEAGKTFLFFSLLMARKRVRFQESRGTNWSWGSLDSIPIHPGYLTSYLSLQGLCKKFAVKILSSEDGCAIHGSSSSRNFLFHCVWLVYQKLCSDSQRSCERSYLSESVSRVSLCKLCAWG